MGGYNIENLPELYASQTRPYTCNFRKLRCYCSFVFLFISKTEICADLNEVRIFLKCAILLSDLFC
jgi:hypothetical protein